MAAAGYWGPAALSGANAYANKSGATAVYKRYGDTMDYIYTNDMVINVTGIINGYNDEQSGTLCISAHN